MPRAKQAILDWLEANKPALVDRAVAESIRQSVGAVSDRTFRHTLIESGCPLDPMVEGVHQSSPADLARTLLTLASLYESADRAGRFEIRRMVMESKSHARLAAANRRLSPERHAEKQEALLWISTWVENPPLFATWLNVRLGRTRSETADPDPD